MNPCEFDADTLDALSLNEQRALIQQLVVDGAPRPVIRSTSEALIALSGEALIEGAFDQAFFERYPTGGVQRRAGHLLCDIHERRIIRLLDRYWNAPGGELERHEALYRLLRYSSLDQLLDASTGHVFNRHSTISHAELRRRVATRIHRAFNGERHELDGETLKVLRTLQPGTYEDLREGRLIRDPSVGKCFIQPRFFTIQPAISYGNHDSSTENEQPDEPAAEAAYDLAELADRAA